MAFFGEESGLISVPLGGNCLGVPGSGLGPNPGGLSGVMVDIVGPTEIILPTLPASWKLALGIFKSGVGKPGLVSTGARARS